MNRLQVYIRRYAEYQQKLIELEKYINDEARELLCELQKIDGWECMILSCKEHYSKYPKNFFGWCSVEHTDDSVQFVKGYSNSDEYVVLDINLNKPLEQQVHDKLKEVECNKKTIEEKEREKDLVEFEKIKKKYGLE